MMPWIAVGFKRVAYVVSFQLRLRLSITALLQSKPSTERRLVQPADALGTRVIAICALKLRSLVMRTDWTIFI